ncbi:hypothetical protein DENSPDRAFT_855591, partial [Dentipellis sp. KUC8613]
MDLNLEQTKDVDKIMEAHWTEWIDEAPEEYHTELIATSIPLLISAVAGQNQRIVVPRSDGGNERAEIKEFSQYADWSRIKHFTFALASHMRARVVDHWTRVTPQSILNHFGDQIFAHYDPRLAVPIDDLANTPYTVDNAPRAKEIRIYDSLGNQIPRRIPHLVEGKPPCALLMDLVAFNRAISAARGNIFHAPLENTRALAASAFTNPSITSYPLAFTRVLGHLQSNRAGIPWFQYIINQINKTIFDIDRPDPPPPNSDDEDVPPPPFDPFRYNNDPEVLGVDAIVPYLRWVALENISAQFYIEAMHRFRASAVEHEAQLGLVGSAAAGSHAKNDKAARIADKMAARVDHDHPSDRFDTLVQDDSIPRDLRMENVYVLHFDHMAPEHRNGRFLFKNVIKPLTDGWSHPHVKNAIVDNIAVLDAD